MPVVTIHTFSFGVVILLWCVFAVAFLFRRRARRRAEKKRENMALVGLGLEAAGYVLVWNVRREFGSPFLPLGAILETVVAVAAMILAACSVWLAIAAISALGKQWSPMARIIEDHELITTGPYRLVRHPIYSALFGLLLATGLTLSAPWALGVGMVSYLAGTAFRVAGEERLLQAQFGEQFLEYRARVPALFPSPSSFLPD